MSEVGLTATDIVAAATSYLDDGGYERIDRALGTGGFAENARVFEDQYSIVAVVVYDTWSDLKTGWTDAQGALVDLISAGLSRADAKSWEGYLVLLTPADTGREERAEVTRIRYDTTRVRKLVATGDSLRTLLDVRRALLPLLPLDIEGPVESVESVLAILPRLVARPGVPEQAVVELIAAYLDQQPLMERLHAYSQQP